MKPIRQQQAWYHWYFHSEASLLFICPGDLLTHYQEIWPKILSACELPSWPSFLAHEHARFILSAEGIALLLQTFQPKLTWLMACPKHIVPADFNIPLIETSADLMQGKIKKEIWLKWMAQKQTQALAS